MKRRLFLIVALVAGCGGGGGQPTTQEPPSSSVAVAPPRGSPLGVTIDSGGLLVATGDDLSELAVFDPDSGAAAVVEAPADLEDRTPLEAIVGENADHVVVSAVDGIYLWDRRSDETTLVGAGGRIVGLHPHHRPALVLVETSERRVLVDLRVGTSRELGRPSPRGLIPRFTADRSNDVGLVANLDGGALVVDVGSGRMVEHDLDLLFSENGLAADGSRVVAGRRSDAGREIVVVDAFDPRSTEVWYTPDNLDAQVQVAWVGDELLAADLTGRVMTMTDGVVTELGRLREEGVGSVRIHPDPGSSVALLEAQSDSGSRWFRVDAMSGVIDELESIEGYVVAPFVHPAGHLLVGLGSTPSRFSHILAVTIADRSISELFEDPAEPVVAVAALSDSTMAVTVVGSGEYETQIVGLDGKARGRIASGPGLVVSPDETRAAVFSPDLDGPYTTVVALVGSESSGPHPGVRPLAWLPPG